MADSSGTFFDGWTKKIISGKIQEYENSYQNNTDQKSYFSCKIFIHGSTYSPT